jgi:hypothetical protein
MARRGVLGVLGLLRIGGMLKGVVYTCTTRDQIAGGMRRGFGYSQV